VSSSHIVSLNSCGCSNSVSQEAKNIVYNFVTVVIMVTFVTMAGYYRIFLL
jgi:hypothetical protein